MSKINQTYNYGMFDLHEVNRDVDKIARLRASMLVHGWIDAYPAHVVKSGGSYKVKGGHHRVTVAQMLGLPIKYVVCDDTATIYELEASTKKWSLEDYLVSHCRAGLADYLEIRKYCSDTGVPVGVAVSMFGGHWAGSGNFQSTFKSGTYKIKERAHPNAVADILSTMKSAGVIPYNKKLMILAVSKMLFVSEFSVETFKRKIKAHPYLLTAQANLKEYLAMLETTYNRQNKDRIPLAHLAEVAGKARNAVIAAPAPLRAHMRRIA